MDLLVKEMQENSLLVIVTAVIASLTTLLILQLANSFGGKSKSRKVNNKVKLDATKIVDTIKCPEIEDSAQCKDGKVVMCRCWKSATFPYCDGSHNSHNKETGDNVGPLIISTK